MYRVQPDDISAVGPTGQNNYFDIINKTLIEKLKIGNEAEFMKEVAKHKVEVRDVVNSS